MGIRKGLFITLFMLGITACSSNEPQAIDIDEAAAEVGLSEDDYTVNEDGAIQIHSKVEEVKATQDKTFGITPAEFSRRFSAEAEEVGLGKIPYGDFETVEGSVNDVFSVTLNEAIAMNGTVDKNGELKGITFIMGQTDNGDKEIINMAMMAGLSARAISPDLPKEQTGGAIFETLSEAVEGFSQNGEGESSKEINNVKYTSFASDTIGVWIVIEPV